MEDPAVVASRVTGSLCPVRPGVTVCIPVSAKIGPCDSTLQCFGGKGFCCSQDQAGSNLRTLRERSSTMLPTHFPIGYSEATSGSLSTAS